MPDLTDEILRTQLTDAVMRPKLNGDPAGNARCWAFLRHGLEHLEGAGMLRATGGPMPDCCDHLTAGEYGCTDCLNSGHVHAPADPCPPEVQETPQDAQNAGRKSLAPTGGTPGGVNESQAAHGAPVRSLGDRLRAAADYQDRPGAYDELRAMADEADRLQNERDAIDESLWRFKESFHEVLGGKPLAEWHAENCGAVEGAEQMRRERDEARGGLAAQERITAELRGQRDQSNAALQRLQPIAQVMHTVRTRGGVGDVAGVRIERVQDGTTATERRLEEVRGALERVRGLHQHGPDHLCTACAEAWPCSTIAALDGGTEAGR